MQERGEGRVAWQDQLVGSALFPSLTPECVQRFDLDTCANPEGILPSHLQCPSGPGATSFISNPPPPPLGD